MGTLEGVEAGTTLTTERTFTRDDVARFAELSGDRGRHHLDEGAASPVMVHGLLTATLPTKLGGDIDYVARRLTFEFARPVVTGQRVTCELTVESVDEREDRWELPTRFVCTLDDGTVVMRGSSDGVVHKGGRGGRP